MDEIYYIKLVYKCKMCGAIYSSNKVANGKPIHPRLTLYHIISERPPAISLTDVHLCNHDQAGIAELIGAEKE